MRLPLILALWMALVAAAFGQLRPGLVLFTYRSDTPTRAYRLADEWFVPASELGEIGWRVTQQESQAIIETGSTKVSLTTRVIGSNYTIPVRRLIEKLGGISEIVPGTDRLRVLSRVRSIDVTNGNLAIDGTLPYRADLARLDNPGRLMIDLQGARLDSQAKIGRNIRASQFKPDVVRLVYESENLPEVSKDPPAPAAQMLLALTGPTVDDASDTASAPPTPGKIIVSNVSPGPTAMPADPVDTNVTQELAGDKAALIRIDRPLGMTGAARLRSLEPTVIELELPRTNAKLPDDFHLDSEFINQVDLRTDGASTIARFILPRPMGVEVWSDPRGIYLQLTRPDVGDGRLAGKLVVVDAGHGGKDSGTKYANVFEKNIALATAKMLAQELAAQGATVIMTRKTDVFVELEDRADIANRNRADFFISVHVNQATGSPTGHITFFHGPNATKEVLARCINGEIAKVTQIPNKGVWSDKRIYDSGFSVLRNTKMPGVLIEMGFINNTADRTRMTQPDFPASIAKAVVKGLKVYLGDGK